MRVGIVGLGGVGGYIAAKLAQANVDVVGFARGEHQKIIAQKGITIQEDEISYNVALSTQDRSKPFDVVLFCTKSYDLAQSAKEMQEVITKDTIVMSLANGVNNAQILQNNLEDAVIVPGCVYILSHIQESGVIRKKGDVFAIVFEKNPVLAKLFQEANLRYKESEDIQKELWKKYIFISAFALLTSFYNLSIYEVVTNHEETTIEVLKEIALVAKYQGIDITKEIQKSLKIAKNLPLDATTSMHKDFQQHKRTELESLGGYLLEEAEKAKIKLPAIKTIYQALLKRVHPST